jgi:hypothetical protein
MPHLLTRAYRLTRFSPTFARLKQAKAGTNSTVFTTSDSALSAARMLIACDPHTSLELWGFDRDIHGRNVGEEFLILVVEQGNWQRLNGQMRQDRERKRELKKLCQSTRLTPDIDFHK